MTRRKVSEKMSTPNKYHNQKLAIFGWWAEGASEDDDMVLMVRPESLPADFPVALTPSKIEIHPFGLVSNHDEIMAYDGDTTIVVVEITDRAYVNAARVERRRLFSEGAVNREHPLLDSVQIDFDPE